MKCFMSLSDQIQPKPSGPVSSIFSNSDLPSTSGKTLRLYIYTSNILHGEKKKEKGNDIIIVSKTKIINVSHF